MPRGEADRNLAGVFPHAEVYFGVLHAFWRLMSLGSRNVGQYLPLAAFSLKAGKRFLSESFRTDQWFK